jgi:predicted DsbA family dithiol-disulfide isomerase
MYAFEKGKDGLNVSDEERIAIAKEIGADEKQFTTCLTEGNYIAKIESDMAEGQKQEIPGTPSIFLNGTLMKYDSKEAFFGMIDSELKK